MAVTSGFRTHNYEDHAVHTAIQSVKDGHTTLDVVFTKMAWSFDALFAGNHPELDWNDNPMPPGSKHGPLADVFCMCVDPHW